MKSINGNVMLRAMLVSALLISLTLFKVLPLFLFVIALLPMGWYHFMYLEPKARTGELTSIEIDSVYYYGFLVTILALAVSALTLGIHGMGDDSVLLVGAQFGLGLIATGYAVAARMHLLTVSTNFDADNSDKVLDAYVLRTRELISNMELASTSFMTFAKTLQENSNSAAADAQRRLESVVTESTKGFGAGVESTLNVAKQSIEELRALVNDAAFGSERQELKKSVQGSLAAVAKLNIALEQMATLSGTSASAASDLTASFSQINERAGLMAERFDGLTNDNGTLVLFQQRLHSSAERIGQSVGEFELAAQELVKIADGAEQVGQQLSALKSAVGGTVKSMQPLGPASERIVSIAGSFGAVDTSLQAITQTSGALGDDLNRMAAAFGAVLPMLEQFGKVAEIPSINLEPMIAHIEQLEQLAAALAPVAISMTSVSDVLGAHMEQIKGTAEANELLRKSISDTVAATPALQARLAEIPRSLDSIEQAMAKTSSSLTTAADSFDRTATEATRAISHVGEKLGDLAGFIIEKTQDRIRSKDER